MKSTALQNSTKKNSESLVPELSKSKSFQIPKVSLLSKISVSHFETQDSYAVVVLKLEKTVSKNTLM